MAELALIIIGDVFLVTIGWTLWSRWLRLGEGSANWVERALTLPSLIGVAGLVLLFQQRVMVHAGFISAVWPDAVWLGAGLASVVGVWTLAVSRPIDRTALGGSIITAAVWSAYFVTRWT